MSLDFVPKSFVGGVVKKNAALVPREGDFGFSQENGEPSAGHDGELVNFTSQTNPSELQLCGRKRPQPFTSRMRGINRPTTIRYGPDGAGYLVNYGAVRHRGICRWCKSSARSWRTSLIDDDD